MTMLQQSNAPSHVHSGGGGGGTLGSTSSGSGTSGGSSSGTITYVIAKYDYVAQSNQELDMMRNEKLLLIDDTKHWWKVKNNRGMVGFIPSNYVRREKPSIFDSIKKKVIGNDSPAGVGGVAVAAQQRSYSVNNNSSVTHSHTSSPSGTTTGPNSMMTSQMSNNQPATNSDINNYEIIGSAIVKYNYKAQKLDELSLVKGSRLLIVEKSADGWWRGQAGNKMGWFPSNYTQEELDDEAHTYSGVTDSSSSTSCEIVVGLYAFQAQHDTELSFGKGERLEVLSKPDSDPDWIKVRNNQSQVGLVPKNYMLELSKYLAATSTTLTPTSPGSEGKSLAAPPPSTADQSSPGVPRGNATSAGGRRRDPAWNFGKISRTECDSLLASYGKDGDFLIRESETNVGDYSVSLKAPGRNKHFRVQVDAADGQFCIGQRRFTSIDQLISHYQHSPIYTGQNGERLFLVKPLDC